jgi:cytochrome c-type biogenesis protein
MEIEGVYLLSALIAGVVSFLAPCTLPLLPAYLGFISGVRGTDLVSSETKGQARQKILKNSILFIVGFTVVFVILGLLVGHLGSSIGLYKQYVMKVGGLVVIAFGLMMLGVVRVQALARDRRIKTPAFLTVGNPISSALLGAIFALGWTPCIGPVLATILLLASTTETALAGGVLLLLFALGLGIPFFLVALLITRIHWFIDRASPYLQIISKIGGVFLVLLGLALLWGEFAFLTSWLYSVLEWIGYEEYLLRFL